MTPKIVPQPERLASPGRGRLLSVADIQQILPHDRGRPVSAQWIRKNVAPQQRIPVGRSVAWWEQDVIDWLRRMAGKTHKRTPRKAKIKKVA